MRSFAAIATVATLAFSALTSALPTPGGGFGDLVDVKTTISQINTVAHDILNPQINGVNIGGEQSNTKARGLDLPVGGGSQQDAQSKGIPDILVVATAQVVPKVQDLAAKVTAGLEVKAALALSLEVLGEILIIIKGVVADINVVIGGDVGGVLCLEGKVLDVKIVAGLLVNLIKPIILVLGLVVKICASIDISLLLKLCVEISAELAVIISLCLKVAVGILVHLGPLLSGVVKIIVDLKLVALIQVLHL